MNIGFVSTRFHGTDGVTLEAGKWAEVFSKNGHTCHWFAGQLDDRPNGYLSKEAFFASKTNLELNESVFLHGAVSSEVKKTLSPLVESIKNDLVDFVKQHQIELLVPQNALCLPMPLSLGVALSQFLVETKFPAIAHHHDFYWERERFSRHALGSLLEDSLPPKIASLSHVTINTAAQRDLKRVKGVEATVVPNVFCFEKDPPQLDDFARTFRQEVGILEDELLFLQPTRVVPRKGIEHAIELAAALAELKPHLVISHAAGDEGTLYKEELDRLAKQKSVKLSYIDSQIGEVREVNAKQKRFTLADAYLNADFVTYPSLYEGFGNALLETIYFKKPVLVNRYSVYEEDIEPKGFKVIPMDGKITSEVVEGVRDLLKDPKRVQNEVEHNFAVAKKHFGFATLEKLLGECLDRVTDIRADKSRVQPS